MAIHTELCILAILMQNVKSGANLLMEMRYISAESQEKSGPIWAWPFSPSWLYLILPLIMSILYLKLKYDLHQYRRNKDDGKRTKNPRLEPIQHPGLTLTTMQEIRRRIHDPEIEAIGQWLGRELSVEEWGRVPLSRMTKRQLQALGFLPGCPILTSPQFKGMSTREIGEHLGINGQLIADHASSQKIPVVETIQWSDLSRFEELSD